MVRVHKNLRLHKKCPKTISRVVGSLGLEFFKKVLTTTLTMLC